MIPVKIGMTIIITRYTVGRYPMNVWLWCFPFRILLSLAFMVLVYITPLYQSAGKVALLKSIIAMSVETKLMVNMYLYLNKCDASIFLNVFSFNRRFLPTRILRLDDFHCGHTPSDTLWNVCGNNGFLCQNQ